MHKTNWITVNLLNVGIGTAAFTLENFTRLGTLALIVTGVIYNLIKIHQAIKSKKQDR